MAKAQHYVFHGYPVSVEQVGEDTWHVQMKNRNGDMIVDVNISEKPIREQLETFVGRMFPRAIPASREAKDWAAEFAKEYPERAEAIRSAIAKPSERGPTSRLQPNPAPASVADLTRRLTF